MQTFQVTDLIECAQREVRQRRRVYKRLVERGSMKPETADREIQMMEAIVVELGKLSRGDLFDG